MPKIGLLLPDTERIQKTVTGDLLIEEEVS